MGPRPFIHETHFGRVDKRGKCRTREEAELTPPGTATRESEGDRKIEHLGQNREQLLKQKWLGEGSATLAP